MPFPGICGVVGCRNGCRVQGTDLQFQTRALILGVKERLVTQRKTRHNAYFHYSKEQLELGGIGFSTEGSMIYPRN